MCKQRESATIAEALKRFEEECEAREVAIRLREDAIAQAENEVKRERLQLDVQKADFQWERDELKLQSESLRDRWSRCSPERLTIASARLEEAQKLIELQQESIGSLTAEKERLRGLIPISDGRPAESILKDLADAQQRVRRL